MIEKLYLLVRTPLAIVNIYWHFIIDLNKNALFNAVLEKGFVRCCCCFNIFHHL